MKQSIFQKCEIVDYHAVTYKYPETFPSDDFLAFF